MPGALAKQEAQRPESPDGGDGVGTSESHVSDRVMKIASFPRRTYVHSAPARYDHAGTTKPLSPTILEAFLPGLFVGSYETRHHVRLHGKLGRTARDQYAARANPAPSCAVLYRFWHQIWLTVIILRIMILVRRVVGSHRARLTGHVRAVHPQMLRASFWLRAYTPR